MYMPKEAVCSGHQLFHLLFAGKQFHQFLLTYLVCGTPHRSLVILKDVFDESLVSVFAEDNADGWVFSLKSFIIV